MTLGIVGYFFKLTLNEKSLKNAVFSAVDNAVKIKYNGQWDKKIDIEEVDSSKKAAKGYWWQKDAWGWIAWQQNDKSWKVLVSFDGFNCKELEEIPSQYDSFFKNNIYPNFGGKQPDVKYCY